MDNTEERAISLFTGYDGIALGLKRVLLGLRVVAYCEREAYACANLVKKIESGQLDAAPIWSDVKTFPREGFRGKIHGIFGGPPCQPVSIAGNRKGKSDERYLWPYVIKLIRSIRPVWCFFENTPGFLSVGYGDLYKELKELGYLVECGIFSAEEVGAPHARKRLFILATYPHDAGNRTPEGRDFPIRPPDWEKRKHAQFEFSGHSETMVYTNGCGHVHGQIKKQSAEAGEHAQCQSITGGADVDHTDTFGTQVSVKREKSGKQMFRSSGKNVSNAFRKRMEAHRDKGGCGEIFKKWATNTFGEYHSSREWWAVEPNVGRVAHGVKNRVDRLQLCGNGVVPATAEKAWIVLNQIAEKGW